MEKEISKNVFNEAMDFRHACKVFDATKAINEEDLNFILEAGRKSPSSFGMEPWKFLVIKNEALKEKIKEVSWNQIQVTSASELIIVLAKIYDVKPESSIPAKRFARRDMPQEKYDFYLNLYANHLSDTLSSDENIYAWTARQTYLASANMMTAAASIGIDSCPIEGFEKDNLEKVLGLDTSKYQVSVILPFGYRLNAQSSQLRLSSSEVVEIRE